MPSALRGLCCQGPVGSVGVQPTAPATVLVLGRPALPTAHSVGGSQSPPAPAQGELLPRGPRVVARAGEVVCLIRRSPPPPTLHYLTTDC